MSREGKKRAKEGVGEVRWEGKESVLTGQDIAIPHQFVT